MPDETNQQQLVKMITIDLTHSYNWRIVHTHHLPGHYKTYELIKTYLVRHVINFKFYLLQHSINGG